MGYAVYEDIWHPGRWAGYGVPAECDMPGCTTMIDRGLGYQCDHHHIIEDVYIGDEWDHEEEHDLEGCYLYFCSEHCYATETHFEVDPKPDHPEWLWWILVAPSWAKWRTDHPERVVFYMETLFESGWRPGRQQFENLFAELETING